jgi:septal ring factor EnvC (AmiA/AmiB activator)
VSERQAVGNGRVVRPPLSLFRTVLPWSAAAVFALVAAWSGASYLRNRSENDLLRQKQALTELGLETAQTTLEAERMVSQRELATINDTARQLALLNERVTTLSGERDTLERNALDARRQLAERDGQLADNRRKLAERERDLASLTAQIEAFGARRRAVEQQLAEANRQIAELNTDMKAQGALADLKITALTSMLKNSPEAVAVAVWDPRKSEGILKVAKLPPLPANQDYQLWIVDPQYANPVDAGVFSTSSAGGESTMTFHPRQPVTVVNAFAVTRERKGGVSKAEGPFVLLGK